MKAFLALTLLLFLSGCVLYDYKTGQPLPGSERLGLSDITPVVGDYNICREVDSDKPCTCMFCRNETSFDILGPFKKLGSFYNSNLVEGSCWFESCSPQSRDEKAKETDISSRVFMFGQGPSFASTDRANLFCSRSLQLATKWLVGRDGSPPSVPSQARAACWLRHDTLPLYIYYTDGKAIDPARTGQIARAFGGTGPVLLTTEVNVDSSDAAAVEAAKQQIVAIKNNCKDCLSVLAVRSGDEEALKKFLKDPTPRGGKVLYDLVDVVGFGFRANDYPTCSVNRILWENYFFTRHVVENYSKPSIWLYAGVSEGSNIDGSCQFDAEAVHNFYQAIFRASQGLSASGSIGASFYEFSDGFGPLPCTGKEACNFGLLAPDGSQKHPAINTWAELCRFYADVGHRNPVMFSQTGFGPTCEVLSTGKMQGATSTEINSQLGLKSDEIESLAKEKGFSCGEVCISDSSMPSTGTYDSTGKGFAGSHCEEVPAIEEYGDSLEISSTYLRALFEQESGFDSYAVSCVKKVNPDGSLNNACNGAEIPLQQICELAGVPADKCPADKCKSDEKACAFGLSQCIEYPGKFYKDNNLPLPDSIQACGGYGYDPFNASQSACCGTRKLRTYLDEAASAINSNWAILSDSSCSGSLKADDRPWATYFLASLYYNAGKKSEYSVGQFLLQRDSPQKCKGQYDNFIAYLRSKNSYAADVFSRYRSAVPACGSDCPS